MDFSTTSQFYVIMQGWDDSAGGAISIMWRLMTDLWPVLIGLFVLFGIFFFVKRKVKGLGR